MILDFVVKDKKVQGYPATPKSDSGRSVPVLHAWWGLNQFFESKRSDAHSSDSAKLAWQRTIEFLPAKLT